MRYRFPRGIFAAALLLIVAGCGGEKAAETETGGPVPVVPEAVSARHVILITADTWRGDHVDTEIAGVPLTPHLSNFAAKGLHFSHNTSVSNLTSAGVAGILTGLLPERSGVVANEHMLPQNLPNLATVLKEQGFATGAFVANPVLKPEFGFGLGFDEYQAIPRVLPFRKAKADAVNAAAFQWLDTVPEGSPVFLWVHYMEPHGPYEPPEDHLELFPLEAFEAPTDLPLQESGRNSGHGGIPHYQQVGALQLTTDGREYVRRYAAEVHSLDEEMGVFFAELERRGLWQDSVVVIGADHGEALAGDHGFYFSHDNGMTEDQVRVPLMLRYPGVEGGRVVDRAVSNVDILPTVLGLLGVSVPGELDGSSLLAPRPFLVANQGGREQTVRDGTWKVRALKSQKKFLLYDLEKDPEESRNLAGEHPERFAELKDALRRIARRPALAESVDRGEPDAEQKAKLKALGYL